MMGIFVLTDWRGTRGEGGKQEAGSGKREAGSGKREAGSGKREAGSGKRPAQINFSDPEAQCENV